MRSKSKEGQVLTILRKHFGDCPMHELTSSSRVFPATARADLQTALEALLGSAYKVHKLVGVHQQWFSHYDDLLAARGGR